MAAPTLSAGSGRCPCGCSHKLAGPHFCSRCLICREPALSPSLASHVTVHLYPASSSLHRHPCLRHHRRKSISLQLYLQVHTLSCLLRHPPSFRLISPGVLWVSPPQTLGFIQSSSLSVPPARSHLLVRYPSPPCHTAGFKRGCDPLISLLSTSLFAFLIRLCVHCGGTHTT